MTNCLVLGCSAVLVQERKRVHLPGGSGSQHCSTSGNYHSFFLFKDADSIFELLGCLSVILGGFKYPGLIS